MALSSFFQNSFLNYFQYDSVLWNSAVSRGEFSEGCKGGQLGVVEMEVKECRQAVCKQDSLG